jgi:hypothetical protein
MSIKHKMIICSALENTGSCPYFCELNKMAMVDFITTDGKSIGGGTCMVSILPWIKELNYVLFSLIS